jgi:hypothetical protein
MSAERTADDYRAALEAAGWATSFRVIYYLNGRVWVARADKDGRSVEGRGDSSAEAWGIVYRQTLSG